MTSKFFGTKICNRRITLKNIWSFLQYLRTKPAFAVFFNNVEGVVLFETLHRKQIVWSLSRFGTISPKFLLKITKFPDFPRFSRSTVIFPGQVGTLISSEHFSKITIFRRWRRSWDIWIRSSAGRWSTIPWTWTGRSWFWSRYASRSLQHQCRIHP